MSEELIIRAKEAVKIIDHDEKMVTDLQIRLLSIFKLLGITNAPNIGTMGLITQYIQKHFPYFTTDEVILAFELVTTGKFGRIDHFHQASIDYIGKVLSAYRKEKQEIMRIQRNKPHEIKVLEWKPTPQQLYDRIIEIIEKHKIVPIILPEYHYWDLVFKYMEDESIILVSSEVKKLFADGFRKSEKERITMESVGRFNKNELDKQLAEVDSPKFVTTIRKQFIREWLSSKYNIKLL